MKPARRDAREVTVHALESTFISSFASARPAPAYLMEDVDVAWTRAEARRITAPSAA